MFTYKILNILSYYEFLIVKNFLMHECIGLRHNIQLYDINKLEIFFNKDIDSFSPGFQPDWGYCILFTRQLNNFSSLIDNSSKYETIVDTIKINLDIKNEKLFSRIH